MQGEKLKVLWLCYFSNSEIQDQIKPYKRIGEFAPWINNMIKLFENDEEVELHVVSQHEWIAGYKHFIKNGVNYYFINKGIPIIGRHWPGFFRFDLWSDLFHTKKIIAGIVKKIRPEIIHMHGTENVFCTVITQFYHKYPVFITVQGFIHKSTVQDMVAKKRSKKELEIVKMFSHFGYRTKTMGKDIKVINPNAVLHWHNYPIQTIRPIINQKKYDLVFFARVTVDKGIVDLLKAVSLIRKKKPNITLCVIGGGKLDPFIKLALELKINENIFWAGFLPSQEDVHKLASKAKISVLPTYEDLIPGTIIESLLLGLPIVAYDVGSIHEVNEQEKIISLVEKFDINGLAEAILLLLNDITMQEEIAEKGYKRAQELFVIGNNKIKADILHAYNEVINEFHNN